MTTAYIPAIDTGRQIELLREIESKKDDMRPMPSPTSKTKDGLDCTVWCLDEMFFGEFIFTRMIQSMLSYELSLGRRLERFESGPTFSVFDESGKEIHYYNNRGNLVLVVFRPEPKTP